MGRLRSLGPHYLGWSLRGGAARRGELVRAHARVLLGRGRSAGPPGPRRDAGRLTPLPYPDTEATLAKRRPKAKFCVTANGETVVTVAGSRRARGDRARKVRAYANDKRQQPHAPVPRCYFSPCPHAPSSPSPADTRHRNSPMPAPPSPTSTPNLAASLAHPQPPHPCSVSWRIRRKSKRLRRSRPSRATPAQ